MALRTDEAICQRIVDELLAGDGALLVRGPMRRDAGADTSGLQPLIDRVRPILGIGGDLGDVRSSGEIPAPADARRHLEVRIMPLQAREGRTTGELLVLRDITERNHAQALQRRSEQLEAVLAAGQQLRLQHTLVDLLQPIAEAARAITGAGAVAAYLRDRADSASLERVALAPVDADDAGPARLPVPVSGEMRAAEETERTLLVPLELMDAGIIGLLRLADVAAELSHDSRDALAILATQTTIALENARLLVRAQEARAEAEAAVRVRDEFRSVAAHELKTPMTSVQCFAQLLLEWLARDEGIDLALQRRALSTIVAQSGKLNQLVCQLLDLSRLERDQLVLVRQETDLVPLAREVMATARAQTAKHTLALVAPPALPAVVDPLRLEQVLTNLLSNALKFSPEGGPVDLTLMTPTPDQVGLAVRDHGLGIPEAQRAGLFARFYQAHAHSHRSGMGLGLYISRQIVEMHGGRIAADFPPDGGTRFVVYLPRGHGAGRAGSEAVGEEVRA
jgi:signal transduction histidine kinase